MLNNQGHAPAFIIIQPELAAYKSPYQAALSDISDNMIAFVLNDIRDLKLHARETPIGGVFQRIKALRKTH